VPSYTKPDAKPDYFRMFNARSEDMKPVFTRLLKQRRCVVLLNGFYEWKKVRHSRTMFGLLVLANLEHICARALRQTSVPLHSSRSHNSSAVTDAPCPTDGHLWLATCRTAARSSRTMSTWARTTSCAWRVCMTPTTMPTGLCATPTPSSRSTPVIDWSGDALAPHGSEIIAVFQSRYNMPVVAAAVTAS